VISELAVEMSFHSFSPIHHHLLHFNFQLVKWSKPSFLELQVRPAFDHRSDKQPANGVATTQVASASHSPCC
jgi:hypothetical protein